MNGIIAGGKEGLAVDRKPIITCSGELEVFSSIEDALINALPQESCEWRRSLGRPVRSVHIGVKFTPFTPEALPREHQWDLIRHPLFHIYWTECSDLDAYKTSVRDDIELWLKELNTRNINDWLIVLVETYDAKRTNKLLPRTTVLDKIRADFAPKQGDRCISVLSPTRHPETRTADSWHGLVARVRHLVSVAYARAVTKLEDYVRQQRERRNEHGWHFLNYFHLQEELAQVLEMLGLYDEALVQYDELDALFSQFVVNGMLGDVAKWLNEFQIPLERWYGLRLGYAVLPAQKPSLLELRAYLFARQAHMLLLTCKPWEMASRCLPFLHTCVRELSLLEVSSPAGAVTCWLFLACLEVLHTCDKFNDTGQVEAYSLYTAGLWAYASQKLRELGTLCGLLPGNDTPTSEQLHIVVSLSAGMGDCPGNVGHPSPTDKLKEALCSKDAFNKHYLELSELAMGTYKHIGRLRSARLMGRELASFYKLLGESQKAAAFLSDALKTFEQDGWRELAIQTHLELASCYKQSGDTRRYIRACVPVAAAHEMDIILRCTYFDEMLKTVPSLERSLIVPFVNVFQIVNVTLLHDSCIVMQDSDVLVQLDLLCYFPREILCTNIALALDKCSGSEKERPFVRCLTGSDLKLTDSTTATTLEKIKIYRHLDYRQDKQIDSASAVCKTTTHSSLKRTDSLAMKIIKSDFTFSLTSQHHLPLVITPGMNTILLKWRAQPDKYNLNQLSIQLDHLEFLSAIFLPKMHVDVRRQEPTVRLDKGSTRDLLAGLEQLMLLTITIGSYTIETGSSIKLCCSKGLQIRLTDTNKYCDDLEIGLDHTGPFSCTRHQLHAIAQLPAREHTITILSPWTKNALAVPLGFTSPLNAVHKLHTSKCRKFVQVIIAAQTERKFRLSSAKLNITTDSGFFQLKNLYPNCNASEIVSSSASGVNVSYMWELQFDDAENHRNKAVKAEFSVEYLAIWNDDEMATTTTRVYVYNFDILNYQTLYVVEAYVEPSKGSEFCRVGALCHLRLTIRHCIKSDDECTTNDGNKSLMYEVLAEQSVWAVCGRTAGVLSIEYNSSSSSSGQSVTLDVMPLTSGFLPLPLIRLSKYITGAAKSDLHPRLEPFSPGQVYNSSKAQQVHVLAAINNEVLLHGP